MLLDRSALALDLNSLTFIFYPSVETTVQVQVKLLTGSKSTIEWMMNE